MKVDVDLSLSAFNNASAYYSMKKAKAAKKEKTSEASAIALKAAVKKTEEALKQVDVKARIQKIRKTFWWESALNTPSLPSPIPPLLPTSPSSSPSPLCVLRKFHWFISSENFLVLGGHDAQQNEALVKKHLSVHDLYVHADVHGASSVIIKNPTADAAVPPLTIQQAATMCICRSSAWKGKVQVEAYYVHASQVSRTAPTGMFLQTGSFMIRGKKNFITRMPMVMGLGVLFRLEDECIAGHKGERRIRGGEEEDGEDIRDDAKDGKKEKKETEGKEDEEGEEEEADGGEDEEDEKADGEPDDDFDVTSAMVKGLSLHGRKAELSEMSSEGDSEAEREGGGRAEERKGEAPKKRLSAAEKRKLKKAQEKGTATADSGATTAADSNGDEAAADDSRASDAAADVKVAEAAEGEDDADGVQESRSARRKKAKGKKEKAATSTAGSSGADAPSAAPSAAPLSRGKRNKLKKISAKYADQDEEDLLIAAAVLGLQNVEQKKAEIHQREQRERPLQQRDPSHGRHHADDDRHHADGGKGEVTESGKAAKQGKGPGTGAKKAAATTQSTAAEVDESDRVCFHCKQRGHVFKNCPLKASASVPSATSTEAGSTPLTFSAARRAAQAEEAQELEQLAEEENIGDPSNVASSPLGLVDTLTAAPFDDDRLQFALVVCAPYSALTSYKFKAKLLPGTQKKGKVCSAALNLWMKQSGVREVERDMLRGMREEEMMAVLLSNTKLAAGLAGEAAKKRRQPGHKVTTGDD